MHYEAGFNERRQLAHNVKLTRSRRSRFADMKISMFYDTFNFTNTASNPFFPAGNPGSQAS